MIAGLDATGNELLELKGYSSTVVRQVYSERKPLVVTGTEEGKAIGSESAVTHNLKSIMAVPLTIHERLLGVVYLDSHLAKGLFTNEDLDLLKAISSHIAVAFRMSEMANAEAERQVLERDILLAAAVQNLFLPKKKTFESTEMSLHGYFLPASKASGDWWWYKYFESENTLMVLLGDVTGHGAASAMMTAAAASMLQVILKNNLEVSKKPSMPEFLIRLNQEFLEIARGDYNMTISGIEIDTKTGKLKLFNASGPGLLTLKSDGSVKRLTASGVPLGNSKFHLGFKDLDLSPGERVLLYTDGISEMKLLDGTELGHKNMQKLYSKTKGMKTEEATLSFASELEKLRSGTPLNDDITFVMIDFAC